MVYFLHRGPFKWHLSWKVQINIKIMHVTSKIKKINKLFSVSCLLC